ncbi:MAG: ABC transporter permease, partial [Candidatus Acidiferrales bacterium]
MRWLAKMSLRVRSLFGRRRADEELDEELRFHVERQTAVNIAAGMTAVEARREAMREFGGVEGLKEECRDMRKVNWLQDLAQDIRYGLRMLRKTPGFTAVAILTLALGIGANTAIFSMVDALVLRPLPVERPGEVVFLTSARKGSGPGKAFSYPDFADIQKQTAGIFSDVSAMGMFAMDGLSVDGNSQSMWPAYVTGNFFRLVGIKPALGRFILPSEGKVAGADPVLVLSYAYWKARFNGDPAIIGKKATVNGHPVTIVGVAPEGFYGLSSLMDFQGY